MKIVAMNVGIMLSEQLESPEMGGGFTFEQEIIEAFLRLRSESPHHFYLLSYLSEKPALIQATGLTWITISDSQSVGKVKRKGGGVFRLGKGDAEAPNRKPLDYESYGAVRDAALEVIVYLNPWKSPFLDIPYIFNMWDLAHRRYPYFPEISLAGEWEAREWFFRTRLQRAAYVITPNECGKREIVDWYQLPEERVRLLHHPTPSFALRAGQTAGEPRSLAHLGINREFLLYPAQFWPHKNHVVLLHALKLLRDRFSYAPQLVLTGSDKPLFNYAAKGNQAYVRTLSSELALQDQVVFAGFVARQDLIALYQQAVALVYPTFFGPENLPPLEAFALGCPVIASRIPGSAEQFGDSALQIDPTDSNAWAEVILSVKQDTALRADLIRRGRKRAVSFTPDDFVKGLFGIIDKLATSRRTWPSSVL
jgi:glycosyltransferase involved in cell wall biosynthesis